MAPNPFPVDGVVTRPAFTDRADEVERIRSPLEEPGAKLLVYGPRRMGKTSALRVAVEDHMDHGGVARLADSSTATSYRDLENRVPTASTRALGRRWKDMVHDLSRRIGLRLEASADPVTGGPSASLGLDMRSASQVAREEEEGDAGTVRQAFLEIIADESEPLRALWASYAATEEKVLRAVASGTESLMAADTLRRFGLASRGAASKAAANLVAEGVLLQEGPGNYRFDSLFQRGWVIQHALPAAGIHLPATHPV